jgi:hypothetical protein
MGMGMTESDHETLIGEVFEMVRKQLVLNGMLDFTVLTVNEAGEKGRLAGADRLCADPVCLAAACGWRQFALGAACPDGTGGECWTVQCGDLACGGAGICAGRGNFRGTHRSGLFSKREEQEGPLAQSAPRIPPQGHRALCRYRRMLDVTDAADARRADAA